MAADLPVRGLRSEVQGFDHDRLPRGQVTVESTSFPGVVSAYDNFAIQFVTCWCVGEVGRNHEGVSARMRPHEGDDPAVGWKHLDGTAVEGWIAPRNRSSRR